MTGLELTRATMRAHKATWYVYVDGHRMPRTSTMRGRWDYDVVCSCGWDSRTGGALRRHVADKLWQHRWEAQVADELLLERMTSMTIEEAVEHVRRRAKEIKPPT